MDTSKQYIEMCDCPEIQGTRELVRGDFFAILKTPINDGSLDVRIVGDRKLRLIAHRTVWLPRQDQLQEMLVSPDRKFEVWNQLIGFDEWVFQLPEYQTVAKVPRPLQQYASMEQLWLAFVMKEKHNKVWNGKWVDRV